jgi:hypothetical protein
MIDYFVDRKNHLILLFTLGYIGAFTFNAALNRNLEFIYYTILMITLLYVALVVHQRLHLGFTILFHLSLLGFLHLAGGNFMFHGVRLYDFFFIPGVLRYDNIVHTYGTFIATLVLYNLLADYIAFPVRRMYPVFALLLVLMAIGIGTLNELVEFLAVVFLHAQEQVGGYFNNSLDLCYNTFGSILATLYIRAYIERPKLLKKLHATFTAKR